MPARPFVLMLSLCLFGPLPLRAQSAPSPSHSVRTVVYHPRDLVSVRAKVHYTTLIVLPDGDEVVEATCGDKEFWIVNVRNSLVSVKPAKAGTETNLNLVTTSGQVYAFLLTEVTQTKDAENDLTVYLEPDESTSTATSPRQKFVPADQLEDFRLQATTARDDARRAMERSRVELDEGLAKFRTEYPLTLRFGYYFQPDTKPFFIRAIFHDDHRTFIRTDARELPAVYEFKDGAPNLVNFDVHDGTYVIPKVLDDGYLMIGKARMAFHRLDGK